MLNMIHRNFLCCISTKSSGFFLSFFLQLVNRAVGLLISLYFLFYSAFQKWHNWLGEICSFSGERILGHRNRQDTSFNLFCFQVLWEILRNAKWVTVAGAMKDLESRKMCRLQCRILKRKPNSLSRLLLVFRLYLMDFVWRSLAWWYCVGKTKCP